MKITKSASQVELNKVKRWLLTMKELSLLLIKEISFQFVIILSNSKKRPLLLSHPIVQ